MMGEVMVVALVVVVTTGEVTLAVTALATW